MLAIRKLGLGIAALAFTAGTAAGHAANDTWTQIDLVGPIETELADGTPRILHPSCSGGPVLREGSHFPVPGSTDYYFFVQKGNPNRIPIALDGGGACWDAATCIGSPLTGSSTYTVELEESPARLANAEGIFDSNNPDNEPRCRPGILLRPAEG